ncbi:hypothetical protein DRN98_06810 [Methanosarcinales archaeon]|nr:MAG: hypothetical protein DRN98_06810 [Methanosarcinales archaeon]
MKEKHLLKFKKGEMPIEYSSVVPFGMQTLFILEGLQRSIHNYFFGLRCGKLKYLRPAYAALSEMYTAIIRPVCAPPLQKSYDTAFEKVKILIDSGLKAARIKAAEELLDIEKNLMVTKQKLKLGLIIENAKKNKGVLSKKYLKDEYLNEGGEYF